MSLKTKTCYMCDNVASSTEHAPPKCFFPEKQDVGVDLRKDLITVPSCDVHNTGTSKDDEYNLIIIATYFNTGSVARTHFQTKILRALQRSPALTARAFNDHQPVLHDGKPTIAIKVDDARFQRVMDKTARALYFHHTGGVKLLAPLLIHSTSFAQTDLTIANAQAVMLKSAHMLFQKAPRLGANPEVFYYQLLQDSEASILRMEFFEGFEVYATWGARITA